MDRLAAYFDTVRKNFNENNFRKKMSKISFGSFKSLEQNSANILQLLYVCLHHSTKTNTESSPRHLLHTIMRQTWEYIPCIIYSDQM